MYWYRVDAQNLNKKDCFSAADDIFTQTESPHILLRSVSRNL